MSKRVWRSLNSILMNSIMAVSSGSVYDNMIGLELQAFVVERHVNPLYSCRKKVSLPDLIFLVGKNNPRPSHEISKEVLSCGGD